MSSQAQSSDQGPAPRPTCAAAAMSTAESGVFYGLHVKTNPLMMRVVYIERMSDEPDDTRQSYLERELCKNGLDGGSIEYSDEENIFCPSEEHEMANYLNKNY